LDDKQEEPLVDADDSNGLLPVGEYVEEVAEGDRKVRRRGIYLLPNLFTTGTLFSGFYAIIAAMHGDFEKAAVAIFAAMFFDGMDGRVARMTGTQSEFGVQYDSLSDMVAFGVAPALVVFSWTLSGLGKVGWALSFVYAAGAALRLARFNTQVATADKNYFTGLASPAAAAVLASVVWVGADAAWIGESQPYGLIAVVAVLTGLSGILMITNIPYHSFKGIDFKGRVPFVVFPVIVLALAIAMIDAPKVIMLVALGYAFSGPIMALLRRKPSA
jgi:CDP-diacylglycerol--serine O-phosphatidyltransferase